MALRLNTSAEPVWVTDEQLAAIEPSIVAPDPDAAYLLRTTTPTRIKARLPIIFSVFVFYIYFYDFFSFNLYISKELIFHFIYIFHFIFCIFHIIISYVTY